MPPDTPRHPVARNFAFSLLSLLVATPLNVVGMLIIARRLGTEMSGVFFSVFAIAIVVYILSGAGIPTVLTRRIAQDIKNYRQHVGEAAGLLLLASFVAFLLMVLSGMAWSSAKGLEGMVPLLLLASIAIAGRHAMEFGVGALRGLERFEFETMTRLVQNGSFCAIVVAFVTREGGPFTAVAAFAVSHLIAALLTSFILCLGFGCRTVRLEQSVVWSWVRESFPLGWGDAIRGMGWHIDTILLSLLGTNVAVGLYNVAYRPLMPLRNLPRALASATFPMMSRFNEDRERLASAFSRSMNVLWVTSLPICIGVTGCSKQIILLLAGREFIDAVLPLQILIWITISIFITTQYRFLLAAMGQQQLYSQLVTATFLLKSIALLTLIPWWGIYGACFGSILAEVFLIGIGMTACHRLGVARLPINRMVRALPPAAIMAVFVWSVMDWTWPLAFGATFLAGWTYLALCFLCGVFDSDEIERIVNMFRRIKKRPLETGSPDTPTSAVSTD